MGKKGAFRLSIGDILLYIFLIGLAVICFLPFYFMIINATHDNAAIARGMNLLPGKYAIDNYLKMKSRVNIWIGFRNSLIVSGVGTALLAYFGTLTAYGFSKYKFVGNKALFWVILCSMMVPPQLSVIGFYDVVQKLKLMNNLLALIIPMIASAQFVYFVKLYLDSALPDSIVESARIDGATEIGIFNKMVLPIASPSIATMGMFNFINSWNQLLIPQIVIRDEKLRTVPIIVANAKGVYRTDFAAAYMAIALSVVPILIAFAFFSKYIIGGVTAGSVKG
ncbi:MAG: carbohydrate ABC transporter permease [Clostridiaceae bacterium]|jgi:multiple sugar transport system permease protein|nr:carbohydrate ABC transporter permease [Clostridiaceae bacterium]